MSPCRRSVDPWPPLPRLPRSDEAPDLPDERSPRHGFDLPDVLMRDSVTFRRNSHERKRSMRLVVPCLMGFIALIGAMTLCPRPHRPKGPRRRQIHHMNITGTVTEVKSGILTVKNRWGDHPEPEYGATTRSRCLQGRRRSVYLGQRKQYRDRRPSKGQGRRASVRHRETGLRRQDEKGKSSCGLRMETRCFLWIGWK